MAAAQIFANALRQDDLLARLAPGAFLVFLPGAPRHVAARIAERLCATVRSTIAVRGVSQDLPIAISPDTGAVPGERIVGILTPGKGITVYPIFARALQEFEDEPDRWVDLTWDEREADERYPARLKILVHNEVGALAQVAQAIGENDGNIENLQMVTRAADFYDLDVSLEVLDVRHLNEIVKALSNQPLVNSVTRANG